ncbi:MAG: aldo/keto reductase [Pseudomonadota bacterium]
MKLGLGTVQFGQAYGITNRAGRPSTADALRILDVAARAGIDLLDTAHSYGNAEAVVGRWIAAGGRACIVTKTPVFGVPTLGAHHAAWLKSALEQSLRRLGLKSVYGLLLHAADDLRGAGARWLVDAMCELRAAGKVAKIGVSIYTARQLDAAVALLAPDIVQLPLNVFDQRLLESGHVAALARDGVEIHVRSVFLQGLLLLRPDQLPSHLHDAAEPLQRWRRHLAEQRLSSLEGALAFAAQIPHARRVLVGVNSTQELSQLVAAATSPCRAQIDYSQFSFADERILNPALWRRKEPVA